MLHVITHSRAAYESGNPHDLAGTELYVGVLPEVYTVHVHFSHEDTISAPQLVDELLGRAGHVAEPLHAQFYLTLQLSLAGPILGQLRDHLEEAPCHPCHEVVPC